MKMMTIRTIWTIKKGDFNELRKHFKEINWEQELTEKDVDAQYSKFCEIYKAGVSKYIPHQREKVKKLNEWFNHASVVQWLARLTTNPRAPVRIPAGAVGAKLTQLSILPFGLVGKWVPGET